MGAAIGLAVRGFFGQIPRWLWMVLIAALLMAAAVGWHQGKAHAAIAAAEKRGSDRAYADMAKRLAAIAAKADQIAAKARKLNDAKARLIVDRADDLRLRGPGAARCPGALPARLPGGHEPGRRPGDAAVAPVPDPQGVDLIGLPFPDAVAFGRVCDLNRNEVLSWRDYYARLVAVAPGEH